MVAQAKYLTGDIEGIKEFISRFDVSLYRVPLPFNIFILLLKMSLPFTHGIIGLPV